MYLNRILLEFGQNDNQEEFPAGLIEIFTDLVTILDICTRFTYDLIYVYIPAFGILCYNFVLSIHTMLGLCCGSIISA